MPESITVYTDGSCYPNPGPGGWAFTALGGDERPFVHKSGSAPQATNNTMEMTAILRALGSLLEDHHDNEVTLWSDSQYVIKGINEWSKGWISRGWVNAEGLPVKNQELWEKILNVKNRFSFLQVRWIKGHGGHKWNEWCDKLAGQARTEGREKVSPSWEAACGDSYFDVKDHKFLTKGADFLPCHQCKETPAAWIFDNGVFAKCRCSYDQYCEPPVRVESISSYIKRHDGSTLGHDDDKALSEAWNRFAETGIYQNQLPKGQW